MLICPSVAIRNPPSYTYELWEGDAPRHYEGRVIPKGTALGIYAAELISHKAGVSSLISDHQTVADFCSLTSL